MSLADQQWCPTSVQVTVQQARGLRVKGKSGTNDAYAVMQVGKEKFQTSVVEKSVAPVWGEEAAFDLPPLLLLHQDGGGGKERCTLHVHVLHRALVGPDKPLGQAVVNLLQLSEDKTRNKTEWFKLLDKTGKADKDRGEVLLDIQFMRNNMTASMFDLSATGKSRSRLGKFKDKVRGKKKESDSASNVVPSFTQVLTDSDEEGDGEVAAGKGDKKKKHKMKSLFSHKSNLQKNMSQSMTVLTAKNLSLNGSQSSGLNVDSSEGKKKFKFLIHKRSNSSDGKDKDASSGNQKQGAAEQSNMCINGSHVYCDEPPPRASRTSSNFSLTSSGHGSMEDVPESFPSSVDSLRAVRQYSPWTEEEEEELENTKEDASQLRREEEENIRMEEEMRRKEEERVRREEELERLADEKKRQQDEERRTEEENIKREEEERVRREEEELERLANEEKKRQREEERRTEEENIKREEEEKIKKEEVRRRHEEEERVKREEEECERLAEQKRRLQEQRRIEEERVRKEEVLKERRRKEEEMVRRQEEEREEKRRIEEQERKRKEEEEKIRMEEERAWEERRQEEEERVRRQEEKQKLAEEKRRLEEEERRIEDKRMEEEMAEEERRRRDEEAIRQKEKLEEQERRQREHEEIIKKEEEDKARREKEECERLVEEERIEAEEKIRRKEEERIRVEEERRKKEEEDERVRRQEEECEQLAEEKRILEEQERRIEREKKQREEEEMIRKEEKRRLEEEERVRKEKEEYDRLVVEKMRQQEQERRKIEEENIKREEERIRREKKAERERKEEARKLEKEKLTKEAEALKRDNKTKPKTVGKKPTVAVESPAEVISTNPFDENVSNNPFEEVPDSPAGPDSRTAKVPTVQQRVQSAAPSVGSKPVSSDEKDAQRERRPAPQPPGRNPAERQSQREQDGATQHLAQINKKSKDKDIKTISVVPQRSVQMIAPLSRSPTETMNTQSLTQSCPTKETSNVAKHGKRTAPPRPLSVEEGPSSDQKTAPSSDDNIPHECGSDAKQVSSVYGLNPFEDDGDENAADKDAASQTNIKSSKARAPQLPAKIAATSSTSINQNSEGGHVTGVTVTGATHTCDPASEAVGPVRVQEAPLQESKPAPAPVQSAGEDAGGKKVGPPKASRRLQPVKPLNPLEQQSVSVVQGVKDNRSTSILCDVQVNDTGLKGPYSQLTQGELISLVLKQEKQLSERDKKISELEQYIDNLLVRVIEEKPSILLSLNTLKKAA